MITIIGSPYYFLYKSVYSDPGIINAKNHQDHMNLYPYDHINFHPGRSCATCNHLKPARSKHCSLCKGCIARSDHHCIFINNCVGYGNMHWFILLLISTAILTFSGAYLGIDYVRNLVQSRYPGYSLYNSHLSWRENLLFLQWAASAKPKPCGVTLLCIFTTPLVIGLTGFEFYMIWAGATTNESGKWSDMQLDVNDGHVYMKPLAMNRKINSAEQPKNCKWPAKATYQALHVSDMQNITDQREWQKIPAKFDFDNIYDIGFLRNLGDVFLPRKRLDRYFRK
jgi:hypothetical protein